MKIFEPFLLGDLSLKNRIVMAPMTRGRAENSEHIPTEMMAEYYGQRASAGLIITEGTWVSEESIGFINVPGIYTEAQSQGWKKVTSAVHKNDGKIFLQLAHTGPISHRDMQGGKLPLAASAVNPNSQSFTPSGFKETETPRAMSLSDIQNTIADFKRAAQNAKQANFDGVELHGSGPFLIPSFLHSAMNLRQDSYGGTKENRARFVLEIIDALVEVWGSGRVGLKLSPAFVTGTYSAKEDSIATYEYLIAEVNKRKLAYLHLMNPDISVAGTALEKISEPASYFRKRYQGTLMTGGGYDFEKAQSVIELGKSDLVAFGNAFISNPDLVERLKNAKPLSPVDKNTFYQGGVQGYTTYPKTN